MPIMKLKTSQYLIKILVLFSSLWDEKNCKIFSVIFEKKKKCNCPKIEILYLLTTQLFLLQHFSKTRCCYWCTAFLMASFLFPFSHWANRRNETHSEILLSFIRIFFFTSSTNAEWRVEIASFGRLEDFRKQWTDGVQWSLA